MELISKHKDKAQSLLIDVEPFYVACTFGLLAINILTTTGARINELLQINNTKECILIKMVKEKLHFSFKAIPKGQDSSEEFSISKLDYGAYSNRSKIVKRALCC